MPKTLVTVISPLYYEGATYSTGKQVEMEEKDVQRHVDAKLIVAGGHTTVVEETIVLTSESSLETLKQVWDTEMSPAEYLTKFPEGPLSDLALRILEAEAEQTEQTATETQ